MMESEKLRDRDIVDLQGLEKRELLKRNRIQGEKLKRDNAIERGKVQRYGPRDVPNVDENDPLIQLKDKVSEMDHQARQRLAMNENLSRKSRDRLKEMMAADSNQRKLLNEGKRGHFLEQNNDILHKLNGPGMRAIKEKFGKVFNKQPLPRIVDSAGENPARKVQDVPAVSHIPALGSFDMDSYLEVQRMKAGEGDPMKNFQFNQVASDSTPPDRYLKDVRHHQ